MERIERITTTPTITVDTVSTAQSDKGLTKMMDSNQFDLSMISVEDREKYLRLSKGINPKDINSVVNFGSDLQHIMNRSSNALLQAVRTNQAGSEVSGLIDDLLSELSVIDVDELNPNKGTIRRFFSKVPIVRHLIKSVDRVMRKYDTVEKNVQTIADKIAATRIVSLRDNNALQKMFQDNIEYIKQIEELVIAGKIRQSEIQSQLEHMLANSQDYEQYEISDMQEFALSLDRRISDLLTLRYVMKQSLPQIRLVQNNNLQAANKAQSIIATTIPVWRNQLSIAVALNNQHNTILAQRKVTDATNEIMKRNADLLHQNSINVARENERNILDIETLRQTTQKLIDTIREVKEIHEQGNIQRKEVETELLRIEQELESSLINDNK